MSLRGYRRPDGRVGFRNHVLVLPTVVCSATVAQRISQAVPGTLSVPNNSGCGLLGKDQEIYARTIINTAGNPNVGATLVVGLGCETVPAEKAAAEIKKFGKPVAYLSIQDAGGSINALTEGVRLTQQLASRVRTLPSEPAEVADLVIGVECGGSDPASGLTANTALGMAVDKVVDCGGTAIISETDECIGAEQLMAANAKNKAVAKRILEVVSRFEKHVKMYGVDLSTGQPARGNIEAGLTTIEEKSLGCVRKIGTRPIVQVLEYGEIPTEKGPILMDTPGLDVISLTGLVAGGCQVIVFTTGLGTPVGIAMTPVIKVVSNTVTYEKMRDNMDINAGTILDGTETIEQVGERIYGMILQVCRGQQTKAEILGESQYSVWLRTAIV